MFFWLALKSTIFFIRSTGAPPGTLRPLMNSVGVAVTVTALAQRYGGLDPGFCIRLGGAGGDFVRIRARCGGDRFRSFSLTLATVMLACSSNVFWMNFQTASFAVPAGAVPADTT